MIRIVINDFHMLKFDSQHLVKSQQNQKCYRISQMHHSSLFDFISQLSIVFVNVESLQSFDHFVLTIVYSHSL